MDFYDIVAETCGFNAQFAQRLGFKQVLTINREVAALGHGVEPMQHAGPAIAFGRGKEQLLALVKHGAPAVAITDSYVDPELINAIADNHAVLCMPMNVVSASYGTERARNIYRMRRLFTVARKHGIEVCFISLAKTRVYMASYMQLVEFAKLIGAEERYARRSVSEINRIVGLGR